MDNGRKAKCGVKDQWLMLMGPDMMDTGKTTRCMGMELILIVIRSSGKVSSYMAPMNQRFRRSFNKRNSLR
jgi:hypothetical protein